MVLREGSLVQIVGVKGPMQVEGGGGEVEVQGKRAQVMDFDTRGETGSVMTFDGHVVKLSSSQLEPLKADALEELDLVLGPKSNEAIVTQEMMNCLTTKGYCVSQCIVPAASVDHMQQLSKHLTYQRVPSEFEPYYLGRDSKEKTILVDFESWQTPGHLADSPFRTLDTSMGDLYGSLAPYLEEDLGIRITSRTNLMIRQTFADDDDEINHQPLDPGNAEKENFMTLMKRKRVCMMHFVGPLTGKLQLIPKGDDAGPEIEIDAAPGVMVIFLTERFQYSHTCNEGATTAVQMWFLSQRPSFQLANVSGDMQVLGAAAKGPAPPKEDPVAVNGLTTLLGGDSKDYLCYWLMLAKGGGDTAVEIPISRWEIDLYCNTSDVQAAQLSGQSYTKHQGYIDGIELFDAKFFGISNSEAAGMDPNQRKILETTYECLVMAGHDLKSLQRNTRHIGVFIGTSGFEWNQIPHQSDAHGCGGADAIAANRVNFSMNLKGASQSINTACSSGLVATHTGKLHLKYKDFDPLEAAVCGGLNLAYSPGAFIGSCGGAMLSFRGRCFTFDATADGYMRGEGMGCVYLNLEDYSRDCFCLVAGSQTNQDGRSASITAPNGPAQERCINAAFKEARLTPQDNDCFECHGTGTALGDPIEVGAFKRIYQSVVRDHTLLVTTSKSNLGHLEGGAGIAGFCKCVLQVMHTEGCPTIHFRETNPHLDLEGFPANFLTENTAYCFDAGYAGVSSFGFGGTNCHMIAYGQNTATSRASNIKDYSAAMREKIGTAPPPEITAMSDDPEEWESSGLPILEEKIGATFQVEVNTEGKAIWREVVETPSVDKGERFYLLGSWNDWGMEDMKAIEDMPGLHTGLATIGENGEEFFHIICDEDFSRAYYPAIPQCTRKAAEILGPANVGGARPEVAWCIQAEPGTQFRVEFYCTDTSKSVTWLRMKEASLQDGQDISS